jgi:outer membrane receptor for ferrienterochelin and colicin
MIRITILSLLLPILSFSQDTIFNKKLSEVKILATQKKESNVAVINIIRNNSVVSDGLSVEFIKKTPDRSVGDALKRVNGVTIQNDKFVLVRGLADRYNLAMLNKTLLPSTEPDRRSFSFDMIPSNLIDNIVVFKSATPSLPGDFAGGVVQITTKDISKNFFSIGFGTSYGSVSTFQQFSLVDYIKFPTQFPSTYNFRVGSNGDRRSYTKIMSSPNLKTFTSLPNLNGNLSFGYKLNKWNVLLSSTSRKTYSRNFIDRQDYQSSTELAYRYKDTSFSEVLSVNGLLNLTYLGENKFSWKTLYNHQSESSFMIRNGENYDNIQDVRTNSSNATIKSVLNSQFEGKIKTFDFNFGYNLMLRDQPDYRVNPIAKSLGVNMPYSVAWRDTYRFWSVMDENGFNGSINKSFGDIKVGGSYVKKLRNFKARIFRYEAADLLNEITNNTDRYTADFDLGSGYVSYDKTLGKFKVNGGLRTELNYFNVLTSDFSGQRVNVDRNYLDYLPSLNLSYNLEKVKYRFSLSKTLARPEFREVANFAYYDFVRNAQLLGNPNLEKSDIYNLDLKWEYYPSSGENISVGLFGKNFIKPIEQIVADGSVPSNLLLTYMNPDKANVYGVEIEVRKKLSNWLDVYANSSLMNSEVNVRGVKRQLQGQSNYVINGGLNLHKDNNTLNLSYNRVGDRISAVGFQGYLDIFENSRNILDIVFLRKIKKGEIKLSIADIFAQPSRYYQKINNRDLIKINNERTISLGLNLNL